MSYNNNSDFSAVNTNIEKIMTKVVISEEDIDKANIPHINIPRFKLLKMLSILFLLQILIFTFWSIPFVSVPLIILIYPYLYRLKVKVWQMFYSVWSLHILMILSSASAFLISVLIRYIFIQITIIIGR